MPRAKKGQQKVPILRKMTGLLLLLPDEPADVLHIVDVLGKQVALHLQPVRVRCKAG